MVADSSDDLADAVDGLAARLTGDARRVSDVATALYGTRTALPAHWRSPAARLCTDEVAGLGHDTHRLAEQLEAAAGALRRHAVGIRAAEALAGSIGRRR